MQCQFDVIIERDDEGYYVASVSQLRACHTQARSLDDVTQRICEAIELCLEVEDAPDKPLEFPHSAHHHRFVSRQSQNNRLRVDYSF